MRGALLGLAGLFLCLQAGAEEIVVASYNVQNYLPTDRTVNGKRQKSADKPESEIQAVVKVISAVKPDILGLCEMGDEDMLADLQKRLKAAGIDLPHREWVRGGDEERHVCLLSRFPIVARNSRGNVPFELNGRMERINRGILDVTVQVNPNYRLRLVGIHLKSRRKVPEYDETVMRAREAWHVRRHVEGLLDADPKIHLVVFGDFNDTKNEYPVRELIGKRGTNKYMMDLWLHDSRKERWTHYWKTADEYARIDFLLVSPALAKQVVFEKSGINDSPFWNEASDHRAIYAAIATKKKP